jgi:hexulose-6-phosphate isomerase
MNRRDFLAASAAMGASSLVAGSSRADSSFKTTLRKALIGTPDEDQLRKWKEAGFEGYESLDQQASPQKAEAARKMAEKHGLRIHSVLYGWANFNQTDSFQKDLKGVEAALRACQAYGAETLLLVPCRIGPTKQVPLPMPRPWEFDIRFDDNTDHLKQVVAGGNSMYSTYIEAHNKSVDASREAVQRLIPTAEKTGVIIALENVWNNLWVKPDVFAHFVASFSNPWVRAYFDIGNHVKYAPPEQWIRSLGKLIVKCHVKDFKINKDLPQGGRFVHPREGDVNWPVVRKALDSVGYNGWMTIEDGGLSLEEFHRRLDLILAGK